MIDRSWARNLWSGSGQPRLGALVVGLSLGCQACATPQPPTVVPHLVRVAAVSPTGLDLEVELQVQNPNSFPLAAEAVRGTLFVARDQKLGQGTAHPSEAIPGGATRLVESQVHIGWESVASLMPLLTTDRLPYVFRGDVTFGGDRLNVTLPFTLEGELTRTQLLEAGIRGL